MNKMTIKQIIPTMAGFYLSGVILSLALTSCGVFDRGWREQPQANPKDPLAEAHPEDVDDYVGQPKKQQRKRLKFQRHVEEGSLIDQSQQGPEPMFDDQWNEMEKARLKAIEDGRIPPPPIPQDSEKRGNLPGIGRAIPLPEPVDEPAVLPTHHSLRILKGYNHPTPPKFH